MQRWVVVTLLGASAGGAVGQVGVKPEGALISVQAVVVNPTLGKVYAIDQRAGTVLVVEEKTGKQSTVPVGKAPVAVAVNAKTNRVYVANRASGTMTVLDGVTDGVVATVQVGDRPFAVAVDSVTDRVCGVEHLQRRDDDRGWRDECDVDDTGGRSGRDAGAGEGRPGVPDGVRGYEPAGAGMRRREASHGSGRAATTGGSRRMCGPGMCGRRWRARIAVVMLDGRAESGRRLRWARFRVRWR